MTNNEIKTKLNEMQEYINNCLLDLNNYPFPAINGDLIKNIDKVIEISHSIEEDIAHDKDLRNRLADVCTCLFRETGWACGGFSGYQFDIFKEKALEEVCDLFKDFTDEFGEYKKKEKEDRHKAVKEFNRRFGIEEDNKKDEEDTVFIDNDFKIQEYDRLQCMLDKIIEDKSLSEFIEHNVRSVETCTSIPFDKCLLSHKINHLMDLFIDCLKGRISCNIHEDSIYEQKE